MERSTSAAEVALVELADERTHALESPAAVWPLAVLAGATLGACLALGTWICARGTPWPLPDWVAAHALWGAIAGGLVSWILRIGMRWDPLLHREEQRRAAAARLTLLWVLLGVVCLVGRWGRMQLPLPVAAGLLLGTGAWALLALPWLRGIVGLAPLAGIDPVRAAVLVALLTAPLSDGIQGEAARAHPSLPSAWRVMLR